MMDPNSDSAGVVAVLLLFWSIATQAEDSGRSSVALGRKCAPRSWYCAVVGPQLCGSWKLLAKALWSFKVRLKFR
jgi:hypothetical protein